MLIAAALTGCFATVGEDGQMAGGGVSMSIRIPMEPVLLVVQPGVSVVRDYDEEIFFSNGYYWARQDQRWYRARDSRSQWSRMDDRNVPVAIVQSPPDRYRHYRGDEQRGP
jgi:hypothetical protein